MFRICLHTVQTVIPTLFNNDEYCPRDKHLESEHGSRSKFSVWPLPIPGPFPCPSHRCRRPRSTVQGTRARPDTHRTLHVPNTLVQHKYLAGYLTFSPGFLFYAATPNPLSILPDLWPTHTVIVGGGPRLQLQLPRLPFTSQPFSFFPFPHTHSTYFPPHPTCPLSSFPFPPLETQPQTLFTAKTVRVSDAHRPTVW